MLHLLHKKWYNFYAYFRLVNGKKKSCSFFTPCTVHLKKMSHELYQTLIFPTKLSGKPSNFLLLTTILFFRVHCLNHASLIHAYVYFLYYFLLFCLTPFSRSLCCLLDHLDVSKSSKTFLVTLSAYQTCSCGEIFMT